ncbi:MAG: hypothetical protein CSA62_10945 [Planctomycetota bacterium]|nr:MAG: hypothetical protein CSA62_10945 [Planctomycetota bacterium]
MKTRLLILGAVTATASLSFASPLWPSLLGLVARPQPCGGEHPLPAQESHSGAQRSASAKQRPGAAAQRRPAAPLHDPREKRLRNIRQLTFGGENAEGYFNSDGTKLVFQARKGATGYDCDQIFELDLKTMATRLISTGRGRTTCAYYHDSDRRILFASTHLGGHSCPPVPDMSQGYVWPLYPSFDIFSCPAKQPELLVRLTKTPGYDAEGTTCYANDRIIFTSVRDGDLELYSMNSTGGDVKRLTHELGYDGGAFFSSDGEWIVWRAHHPKEKAAIADYKRLLAQGLVRPSTMEIFVAKSDGSQRRQVTKFGKASFAPFFFPSNKRVIFAANLEGPRSFNLYAIDVDGKNLERVTYSSAFNSFPMFSPDGKYLVFASNRNNARPRETNLFLAEWVEDAK